MGRPKLRLRVRSATEGLRARVSATPDIWDGYAGEGELDDVSDWLELPPDFRAPDDDEGAYRRRSDLELDLADEYDDPRWKSFRPDDLS